MPARQHRLACASVPETSWLELAVLALLTLLVIAQSQVFALGRFDTIDDELFAYFGWCITQGATLYRDIWDNKPPGIFWTNALGFVLGRGSYLGAAGLCVAAVLAMHVLFYRVAAAVYPRGAAALATALASLYLCHSFFAGATNRTETYVMLFELAAVAVYVRAVQRPAGWKWPAIGVCCGLAFAYKQVGLAACGAICLHLCLLALTRRITWRSAGVRIAAVLAGAAGVVAVVAVVLLVRGSLDEALRAVFGFNRAYFAVHDSSWSFNYANYLTLRHHALPILTLPLLLAAATLIHAALAWWLPQHRPQPDRQPVDGGAADCPLFITLCAAWMLAAMYGAMLGPHAWRHYWLPVLPPLLLLGVYTLNLVKGEMRLLPRVVQRGSALVALLAIGYFASTAVSRQWDALARIWIEREPTWTADSWWPKVEPSKLEAVGQAVQRLSGPDARMYCWNYYPGVYLYSRRLPACRFATIEKTWQVGDEQARFILNEVGAALYAQSPEVFVCDWRDYQRLTTTQPVRYRNALEPWLGKLLAGRYKVAFETPDFYVLLRTSNRPIPPPPTHDQGTP